MWSVPMALVRMRWAALHALTFNPHNELWDYGVWRVYDTWLWNLFLSHFPTASLPKPIFKLKLLRPNNTIYAS